MILIATDDINADIIRRASMESRVESSPAVATARCGQCLRLVYTTTIVRADKPGGNQTGKCGRLCGFGTKRDLR